MSIFSLSSARNGLKRVWDLRRAARGQPRRRAETRGRGRIVAPGTDERRQDNLRGSVRIEIGPLHFWRDTRGVRVEHCHLLDIKCLQQKGRARYVTQIDGGASRVRGPWRGHGEVRSDRPTHELGWNGRRHRGVQHGNHDICNLSTCEIGAVSSSRA